MSEANLAKMFARADPDDVAEGKLAFVRYRDLMQAIAIRYSTPLPRVVAGFVSLSPNSDYMGNLRSLVSVLDGIARGYSLGEITVSTYKHCRDRAYSYIRGEKDFVSLTHGLKVFNFYHNILYPESQLWVTVDGHVVAAWKDQNLTMKEAIIRRKRDYREIAHALKRLAFRELLVPNQYQATLWFARKRHLRIKYDPQMSLFGNPGDLWQTAKHIDDIRPYPRSAP